MCRLILTNRKDFDRFDRKYNVLSLMQHLEQQCGGHGNGYALIKDGKVFAHNKGVKLTNAEIYTVVHDKDWDWLIWHTRIKSSGLRKDDNSCHPFIHDNDCIAMNGTEYGLEDMACALNIIDTQVIFKLLDGVNIKKTVDCLSQLSSVFIGAVDGIPYTVNAGGSLYRWGKSTFHASTFPLEVRNTVKTSAGYTWINGLQLVNKKKTRASASSFGYSYGYGYGRHDYDYESYVGFRDEPKPLDDFETIDEYEEIYQEGHKDGYSEGYAEGYEQGSHDGVQQGYNDAIEEYILGKDK